MIKIVKRKRNPFLKKEVLRVVAELLAKVIYYKHAEYFYLAKELLRRNSLYCEECIGYDIEHCDWEECYPEMHEKCRKCGKNKICCRCDVSDQVIELARNLGITQQYLEVFIYSFQLKDKVKNRLDLSNKNLSGLDISALDLSYINLSLSNVLNANLADTKLINSKLIGTNFNNSNLFNVNFNNSNLSDAILTNTDLNGANFENAYLEGTVFTNAKNINKAINLRRPNPRKFKNDKKN